MTTVRQHATSARPRSSRIWYRAILSAEQVAAGHVDGIGRLFAEAIAGLIESEGACLFVISAERAPGQRGGTDSEKDAVFFSPASISAVPHLIAQYNATPSAPPDRVRAALLVGRQDDWNLLPHSTH